MEASKPDSLLYERLNQRSIPALDGCRALAVLAVVLHHLDIGSRLGPYGVMTFFVLSGFLITWLLLQELQRSSTISLRSFYLRRTLRIFPAFYAFWVVDVVLSVVYLHRADWAQFMATFFYLNNYYIAIVNPPHMAMQHLWSLGVEEQFYLLWPWFFLKSKDDLPKLTWLVTGIIGFVWLYRIVLHLGFGVGEHWLYHAFDTRMDHLAIGCLMALLLYLRRGERYFQALCRHAAYPVITIVLLAGMFWWCEAYNTTRAFTMGYILIPVLMAVLLTQWIALSGSKLWSWLDSPVVRYCGRISYSIYLYHWFVDWAILFKMPGLSPGMRVLIALPCSVAVASLSYYFVERPFLRLKERFQPSQTKGAPHREAVGVR